MPSLRPSAGPEGYTAGTPGLRRLELIVVENLFEELRAKVGNHEIDFPTWPTGLGNNRCSQKCTQNATTLGSDGLTLRRKLLWGNGEGGIRRGAERACGASDPKRGDGGARERYSRQPSKAARAYGFAVLNPGTAVTLAVAQGERRLVYGQLGFMF